MSVQVRYPRIQASWNGDIKTDRLRFRIGVNTFTNVAISAYTGTDAGSSANRILSRDAAAMMGRAQTASMSVRTSPDLNLRLDDGAGNTLRWNGYVSGPSYMVDGAGNSLQPAISGLGADALVASLRLDAYTGARKDPKGNLIGFSPLMEDKTYDENLANRLTTLTEEMIKYWKSNRIKDANPLSQAIKSNMHLTNESGPLEVWNKILSNSQSGLSMDWLKAVAQDRGTNSNFNSALLGLLRGQSESFMSTIMALADDFSLLYIPDRTGAPGKLVQRHECVFGETTDRRLPASAVVMGHEESDPLLPVQQVIITGITENYVLMQQRSVEDLSGESALTGYPLTAANASGNVKSVPLPNFMQLAMIAQVPSRRNDPMPTVPSTVRAFTQIDQVTARVINEIAEGMASSYAKSVYATAAIGGSGVTVRVPLDFSWEPGVRYRIGVESGPLFRGFLDSVTHTVSLGEAMTDLAFTYAEYGSFTLPE